MKAGTIRAKLKKAVAKKRWEVPRELKPYVTKREELRELTKKCRRSFGTLLLKSRRSWDGTATR